MIKQWRTSNNGIPLSKAMELCVGMITATVTVESAEPLSSLQDKTDLKSLPMDYFGDSINDSHISKNEN